MAVQGPTPPLDPTQQTAAEIIKHQLEDWGIGELYKEALDFIKQGLGQDAILLQLQSTDTYKRRFIANEDRRKKSLPVLSPAEYVDLERQYKNVMRTYGLPAGFYDSNDDLTKFIARDVSPQELNQRAQDAQLLWLTSDNLTKQAWRQYYGLSDGEAIASILDPDIALPIVQRRALAAQIGGSALRNDLSVTAGRAEQLADLGVDAGAAKKGYSEIGQSIQQDQALATRFGQQLDLTDEENARIVGVASAQQKLRSLQNQEQGLFQGRSAANSQSLSKSTSGSY